MHETETRVALEEKGRNGRERQFPVEVIGLPARQINYFLPIWPPIFDCLQPSYTLVGVLDLDRLGAAENSFEESLRIPSESIVKQKREKEPGNLERA